MDITQKVPKDLSDRISTILGCNIWTLYEGSDDYTSKVGGHNYSLKLKDNPVARWELLQMLHCCGICVSTSAYVHELYRNKDLGTVLNLLRIYQARKQGYGCLMCTDIESNTAQRKILKKNGWTDIHSFINPRTKNKILLSVINL